MVHLASTNIIKKNKKTLYLNELCIMTGDGYPFQIMFFFSTEQIKSINMKFYLEELFEQNQNLLCHAMF